MIYLEQFDSIIFKGIFNINLSHTLIEHDNIQTGSGKTYNKI